MATPRLKCTDLPGTTNCTARNRLRTSSKRNRFALEASGVRNKESRIPLVLYPSLGEKWKVNVPIKGIVRCSADHKVIVIPSSV
jgi:hypothetical protein